MNLEQVTILLTNDQNFQRTTAERLREEQEVNETREILTEKILMQLRYYKAKMARFHSENWPIFDMLSPKAKASFLTRISGILDD